MIARQSPDNNKKTNEHLHKPTNTNMYLPKTKAVGSNYNTIPTSSEPMNRLHTIWQLRYDSVISIQITECSQMADIDVIMAETRLLRLLEFPGVLSDPWVPV